MRLLFFGFVFSLVANAQQTTHFTAQEKTQPAPPLLSLHSVTGDVFPLVAGYQFEWAIARDISLLVHPYIGVGGFSDRPLFSNLLVQTGINVDGRWYYNRAKRATKGKSLSLNAGNFVGLGAEYAYAFYPQDNYDSHLDLLIVPNVYWGIRRPLSEHFFFEVAVGLRYQANQKNTSYFPNFALGWTREYAGMAPTVLCRFGYVFQKRKSH